MCFIRLATGPERESITVQLVSYLTGLDSTKKICCYLYVEGKATKSKPVTRETSCTVILPPTNSTNSDGWPDRTT